MSNYKITDDDARNLSNVAHFKDQYWFAYYMPVWGWKELNVAFSPDMKTWQRIKVKDKGIGKDPHTSDCPQLVAIDGALYLFWMDIDKKKLLATKYAADPKNPAVYRWYGFVSCQTATGASIKEGSSGSSAPFGAVVSGNRILISVNRGSTLDTYAFDTSTWSSSWRASADSQITIAEWQKYLPNLKSFGKNQAMTLFSLGGERTYLLQMLHAIDTSGSTRWLSSLRRLSNEDACWGPRSEGAPSLSWYEGADHGLTTCLDPGGRVLATYVRSGGKVYSRTLATATASATAWGSEKAVPLDFSVSDYPIAYFTFGSETLGKTGDGKVTQQRAVTRWNLVERSNSDKDYSVDAAAGFVRKTHRAETLDVTRESSDPQVYAQGYVDGPPPVFDGMVDPRSEVDYAVTSAVSQSKEVVTNVTVGIKSEASGAPEIGVGPKWEASFNMTAGVGFGHEVTKSLSLDTIFQAGLQGGAFRQTGLLRYSNVVLCRDAYEYLPDGQAPVVDGPICTSIYVDFQEAGKHEYQLGTVTVGKLETYTASAWNERMKGLYPGKNYIDDVVKPNAIVFANGQPTVVDTWTPGSPVHGSFSSTAEKYACSSMTLDASLFVGVTTKFFGAEASFMAGFQVVNATTEKSVTTDGFGVSVDIDGEAGGPVARYRVATYLLGASQNWVTELVTLQSGAVGHQRIDPNGACWKIMYVVDQIVYDDPLAALDLPAERLSELQARELATTQDLVHSLGLDDTSDLHGVVAADADPESADLLGALRAWDARRNLHPERTEAR